MEKLVYFRDRQELQAEDLNNLGNFSRTSLDHIVKDGIQDGKGWTEFTVAHTSTAEVTVEPGRVYSAGAVYVSETDVVFDMLSHLPSVNQKWAAIVGWGQNVETDTQPRDFLIDALDGTTEPQAVAMQKLRKANINAVYGVEAAQPIKPSIDSANVVIAWILLGPSDIVSIELEESNRLPQVARNHLAIKDIEDWRDLVGARVDALASELARIQQALSDIALADAPRMIDSLAADVARLKEIEELDDNFSDYGADRYLNDGESATEDVNFLAKVEEGVRFSDDAANETAIALFNPIEPNVKVSNGLILPTYTEKMQRIVSGFNQPLSISQYTYATHTCVQKTISRTRIRYGNTLTICTNNRWWKSGQYDSTTGILRRGDETWQVLSWSRAKSGALKIARIRRFWTDTYTEKYWDHKVINHTIPGMLVSQTFIQPNTSWCTGIGLYFTQKGATGDVQVLITEVDAGVPNLDAAIMQATLPVANINVSANASLVTKLPIQPTLLEAGKRYGIVLITPGDHYVGMAHGTKYAQGTFFVSVDGAYQIGSFEKDMMFSLYTAEFPVARREINLQAMSLSGGISYIDIIAAMAVPDSTELVFECQINGVWRPLADVEEGNSILYGLPPLIPLRAVFIGTTDVQPGIMTTDSALRYARPRTTFKHISTQITTEAPTQSFKVMLTLENYKELNHDCTCTIQLGGAGGEVAPATVTDVELLPPVDAQSVDHKNIRRTFTWTATEIVAPTSEFRITIDGTTTSALDVFHVAERVHLAF